MSVVHLPYATSTLLSSLPKVPDMHLLLETRAPNTTIPLIPRLKTLAIYYPITDSEALSLAATYRNHPIEFTFENAISLSQDAVVALFESAKDLMIFNLNPGIQAKTWPILSARFTQTPGIWLLRLNNDVKKDLDRLALLKEERNKKQDAALLDEVVTWHLVNKRLQLPDNVNELIIDYINTKLHHPIITIKSSEEQVKEWLRINQRHRLVNRGVDQMIARYINTAHPVPLWYPTEPPKKKQKH